MLRSNWFVGVLLLGFALIITVYPKHGVQADVSSCSASIQPGSVNPAANATFTLTVTNTSAAAIQYLGINVPAGNFFYTDNGITDWSAGNPGDGSGVVLNGSSIDPGQSEDFQVFANSAVSNEQPSAWTVQASDDPEGADPFMCGGNPDTAITGHPPNNTDQGVSNIVLSNIAATSVTVTWDSDVDTTSLVYYGKTANLGSWSNHYKSPASSHTVNLTGLSPNTTYHFQVAGQDDSFNPYYSAENTFDTLPGAQIPASNFISTPVPIKDRPTEKTPPTVKLLTAIKNPYKQTPSLSGEAADNEAVAGVEYSVDGGKNWLPADQITGLGTKTASFSFTSKITDDGNYMVAVRAVDTSGNTTQTAPVVLVIDRLPPLVGGSVVSLGPQVLTNTNGEILTQAGVDEKITLSAVGGPTNINLTSQGQNKSALLQTFKLNQSPDSGLWSGIISFKKAGTYYLTANSIDGAGNKTSKQISKVTALPAGRITDIKTKKPISGQVTAYIFQPDTNGWGVWDGRPYGQTNPQPVSQDGQFSFLLPAGKYYLSASAAGHHNLKSNIFELTQPSPLSTTIGLKAGRDIGLLSWLNWSSRDINVNTSAGSKTDNTNRLVGKLAPSFSLSSVSGQNVKDVSLLGKPTDLVFMNTWTPTAADQLPALNRLSEDKDVNIELVGAQEGAAKLGAYNEISGYNLNWLADPDSTTTQSFDMPSLPTHYFIDRNGIVRHVISGVMNKQEILNELVGL